MKIKQGRYRPKDFIIKTAEEKSLGSLAYAFSFPRYKINPNQ